jgi:hypothetical protein
MCTSDENFNVAENCSLEDFRIANISKMSVLSGACIPKHKDAEQKLKNMFCILDS